MVGVAGGFGGVVDVGLGVGAGVDVDLKAGVGELSTYSIGMEVGD